MKYPGDQYVGQKARMHTAGNSVTWNNHCLMHVLFTEKVHLTATPTVSWPCVMSVCVFLCPVYYTRCTGRMSVARAYSHYTCPSIMCTLIKLCANDHKLLQNNHTPLYTSNRDHCDHLFFFTLKQHRIFIHSFPRYQAGRLFLLATVLWQRRKKSI